MIFARLAAALRGNRPAALVTRLDGPATGAKLLILPDTTIGDLGSPELTRAATAEARTLLAAAESGIRTVSEPGSPGADARIFIQSFVAKPEMYIFGAIDFARPMARIGRSLGYRVSVIDARPAFATRERLPDADRIVVAWPDEFLATAPVDERTALIVLTHDPKFDIPLLRVALRTSAGYVGALGSRRTHADRIAELRRAGIAECELERISAPIGLNIGARTPDEMAIAIAAEIIAVRERRPGGRLRDDDAPIHRPAPTTASAG